MTRWILVPLTAGAFLIAGCTGPPQRGIEARQKANDRFDRANTQVVYDQARQALATGQFEVALSNIDRAIERYPKSAPYLILRGRILMEQRRMQMARESLDQALVVDPKSAEAEYFLGVLFQRCGDNPSALEHYAKASELDPKNLQFLAACVELHLATGDTVGARELLDSAAPSFEFNPTLQHLRSLALSMEGRHDLAVPALETAVAHAPDDARLAEDLLLAHFDAGDWSTCLSLLQQPVLGTVRDRPDMIRLRARCLIMVGRAVEARDLLLANTPVGEPPPEYSVVLGYASWSARDWTRLQQLGERLVAANPGLAEGYLFLGACARERGSLQDAERWLSEAESRSHGRQLVTRLRTQVQAQLVTRGATAQGG